MIRAKEGIERLVRPHLRDIETYAAAEPLELQAEKAGIPADKIVRLNANENPYGGSDRVAEAVAKVQYHLYSDPTQRQMRRALSKHTGMDESHIIVGSGSDELIDLLFRLIIEPEDNVIDCEPTFGMYSFCARIVDARIKLVPRDEDFEVDVDAVTGAVDAKSKMIFLTSPNNPTGNLATAEQVRAVLDTGLLVVIDEAYHEFAGETLAGLVPEYENLVVLRTMSKWAGIAGLRVGYGMMSPKLVDHLMDIKPPFNVNAAGEAGLLVSLEDAGSLMEKVDLIVRERQRMFAMLEEIPGVTPLPSRANYILCRFEPGRAPPVFDGLTERAIFVRRFSNDRLKDCFRISVGTQEDTDAVLVAIAELV